MTTNNDDLTAFPGGVDNFQIPQTPADTYLSEAEATRSVPVLPSVLALIFTTRSLSTSPLKRADAPSISFAETTRGLPASSPAA